MAFLDEDGVETLSEQIRTLADATYVPLNRTINGNSLTTDIILYPKSYSNISSASLTLTTSGWTGATASFTTTTAKLVYIYASVRVAGVGLDEATGQTRPRTFLYESDHARRSPVYFLPAGTYYIYGKGTSAGSATLTVYEVKIS